MARYLGDVRRVVLDEIRQLIPRNRARPVFYDLMLDYPLRAAKAMRPALCIATCCASGGRIEDVALSASVIELLHNAFLVHDDVEDGSRLRRSAPALHRKYGVPIAVNVGDGMLALAFSALVEGVHPLGPKGMEILKIVSRMATESAEGQALELAAMRWGRWCQSDMDYIRMVHKKTSWYSFVAPLQIGGVIGGMDRDQLRQLGRLGFHLGLAFQIRDDVLNLTEQQAGYGKDVDGDLVEGKHTLILLHMLRSASASELGLARRILRRPPSSRDGHDVAQLKGLIVKYASIDHANRIARKAGARANQTFESLAQGLPPSVHLDFLRQLLGYLAERPQ
jgi:geranylgeranyl diphosphate synthase, type II